MYEVVAQIFFKVGAQKKFLNIWDENVSYFFHLKYISVNLWNSLTIT